MLDATAGNDLDDRPVSLTALPRSCTTELQARHYNNQERCASGLSCWIINENPYCADLARSSTLGEEGVVDQVVGLLHCNQAVDLVIALTCILVSKLRSEYHHVDMIYLASSQGIMFTLVMAIDFSNTHYGHRGRYSIVVIISMLYKLEIN